MSKRILLIFSLLASPCVFAEEGKDVRSDIELESLIASAEKGNALSQFALGAFYGSGLGVEKMKQKL